MNLATLRAQLEKSDRLLEESKRLYQETQQAGARLVVELGLPPAPPNKSRLPFQKPLAPKFRFKTWRAADFDTVKRFPERGVAICSLHIFFEGQFDGWVIVDLAQEEASLP